MNDIELRQLLSEGIGGKNRPLDVTRFERDIEIMLQHTVDVTGQRMTIPMFGSGLGSFDLFLQEVQSGETSVRVVTFEGMPRLLTFSEKVQISFIVDSHVLVERWRKYILKDGLIIPTTTFKVVQGTLKRKESAKSGAVREMREECELDVAERELSLTADALRSPTNPLRDWRESSVYPGVLRTELRHKYQMVRQYRPWEYKESPPDNSVIVLFVWEQLKEEPAAAHNNIVGMPRSAR